jgi:acetylornithine deacetylase/succinyl-diaminopimelate desuccinylase-like protein
MNRFAPLAALFALAAAPCGAAPPTPTPDSVRAEAREIFAAAIGYETSIGHGQVPKLAEYLAERFRKGGFPAADVHVLPLGETASLVVRYRGTGKGGRPVAFLAHMDVVTAKRSDWQRDPFKLTEENGYFFGRGTSDVKQEVALLSETFLRLKAEGFVPSRDLIIAFSGDEETAQATAEDLVRHHRDLVDAEFALNGDGGGGVLAEDTGKPSLFYVQGAEKYSVSFSVTTRNAGGHSSQPRADNAIYELADALKAIQGYEFPVHWNDWTLGDFRAASQSAPAPLAAAMTRYVADPHDAEAVSVITKYPQYVGKLRTTCIATMLQGGHAENALPQSATATVNCRVFPGTTVAEVEQTLQRLTGPKVEVKRNDEPTTSDASPLREDVMRVVTRAVEAANPGARIVPTQAAYATDGLVYRNGGIPTYGVGSTFEKESEVFAHGLNERIPVTSFYNGLSHWYVLIKALAGKG